MAIEKGNNSYATVAEADLYFADRLDVAAWAQADEASKGQALVTAAGILDEMSWIGIAVSVSQPLAFPRLGSYFDPRLGTHVSLDTSVPVRVSKAAMELAYHLLNNDGVLDDTGRLRDMTIGSVQFSNVIAPNLVPGSVKRLIRPLLQNAGARNWWRAN